MNVASRSVRSSWQGCLPVRFVRVAQHQPPGVTVGGDGIGAGMALVDQPLGEERFQGRGEVRS